MLHARGRIDHLVHSVGRREGVRHAAHLTVDIDVYVAALGAAVLMQDGRTRLHRRGGLEHRRQDLVAHLDQPAGALGGGFSLGDHRGHALAGEAHHIIEDVGVVGINEMVLVGGGAVEPARNVLPGEDVDHARHRPRFFLIDGDDARMRVRRAQHLEMQDALDRHVHGVAGAPRDDALGERVRQARPAGPARHIGLDGSDPGQRVGNGAISRAPAQVALERMGKIGVLLGSERGRGHDHARGAEAALEGVRVKERLLHGMDRAVRREALDGRDPAAGRTISRHQAGMERHAVEPDRAGAAIAGVTAFLHPEGTALAQERAQALPRLGRGRKQLAVDDESAAAVALRGWRIAAERLVHLVASGRASSARISSAK